MRGKKKHFRTNLSELQKPTHTQKKHYATHNETHKLQK